ncbi:hypothetical protein [Cetobacterium sp.]|uniref:hypothetical protein n=1 Tax=Cetobacterium sp. TaxID=2071632 RepID=UPI003F2A9A0B
MKVNLEERYTIRITHQEKRELQVLLLELAQQGESKGSVILRAVKALSNSKIKEPTPLELETFLKGQDMSYFLDTEGKKLSTVNLFKRIKKSMNNQKLNYEKYKLVIAHL